MKHGKITDNKSIQRYIGNEIYSFMRMKDITITFVAKKLWLSTPYVSWLLNWVNSTWKVKKFEEIADIIWMDKQQLNKIIRTAKTEEFMETNFKDKEGYFSFLKNQLDKEDL